MQNREIDNPQDGYFGPVISTYSRAQAIDDGVLVDVTRTAREAGFKWPVALTHAAWCDCVTWTERDNRFQLYQDESGRLWDVLYMASWAIRSASQPGNRLNFSLYRVPRDGQTTIAKEVTLKLIIGPGDRSEPVVTILLPDED